MLGEEYLSTIIQEINLGQYLNANTGDKLHYKYR